jgi:uncharacterized protein
MTLDEIRTHLEDADASLTDAISAAMEQSSALAPLVLEVVTKAAKGVYLIPRQRNLLFFGLHVLAAARETSAYLPFLDVLRLPEDMLERFLGEGLVETSSQLLLGFFDGDATPLYALLEDASVDGVARWSVFQTLARLAWDGRIDRDRLVEFLDRFDRENLALPDDPAWEGWQDAVLYLDLVSFEDRVRRGWNAGRIAVQNDADREGYLESLHYAATHPDDPKFFIENGIVEITDPVEHLASHEYRSPVMQKSESDPTDPAGAIRLSDDELDWLAGFLLCKAVPETAMDLEELDGFFCALVSGPETVLPSEYFPTLWGTESNKGPSYDSLEQAQYVLGLLTRHWNTIAVRLNDGAQHVPLLSLAPAEDQANRWAMGFLFGLELRRDAWTPLILDEDLGDLIIAIFSLAADGTEKTMKAPDPKSRQEFVESLPLMVQAIHQFWRLPASERSRPARSDKVGRNDPCPCGSGRKYKKCCGAGDPIVH